MCYVATWQVVYFNFPPDYLKKYQAYTLEKARADGETEEAIAAKKAELEKFEEMYQNPAINAAFTIPRAAASGVGDRAGVGRGIEPAQGEAR